MVLVMGGVGVTTAAMGSVPSHASVGVLAPILFLALRVVQGLFVGGVTATMHTLGTVAGSRGPRGPETLSLGYAGVYCGMARRT